MKITIKIASSFYSLKAESIEILGFNFALHRTINKAGWTITDPRTGLALVTKAKSRELARATVVTKINCYGVERFRELVGKHASLPSPEGLPEFIAQIKTPATKADIPAIVAAIHNTVPLSEREKQAVVRALNSRTGQLKAKAPSAFGDADERLAAAAWQGLQPNAFKIGIFSCISLRGEARDLFDRLSKIKWPAALDKDKLALVNAGVW